MTVVCRPYRLEATDRDLILRRKHAVRPSFARFVGGVGLAALLCAVILHLPIGRVLADVAPAYAAPQTVIPTLAWIGTLSAGLFFARRMDAASAAFAPMPEQTVTVAPEGIRVETPVSVTDWRWDAWTRFHDAPEGLLLEEPSGAMLVLPARAFADGAARDAVRAMVAERRGEAEGCWGKCQGLRRRNEPAPDDLLEISNQSISTACELKNTKLPTSVNEP